MMQNLRTRYNYCNAARIEKLATTTPRVLTFGIRYVYNNDTTFVKPSPTTSMVQIFRNRSIYLNGAKFQNSPLLHQRCGIPELAPTTSTV